MDFCCCLLYHYHVCWQGGLRAVVYTDTFQAVVIVVGVLTLVTKGVYDLGGLGEVWRRALDGQRLDNVFE
jgi:Na+/pantothenate symporter